MNYFLAVAKALGTLVDELVPFALGARTKIAVLACPVLVAVHPFMSAIPAPYNAILPIVEAALCTSAPLFAVAGMVRDLTDPKKK